MPSSNQRTFLAVTLDPDLKAGLDALKERDGIPINFQVAKAVRAYLEANGIEIGKGGAKKTSRTK